MTLAQQGWLLSIGGFLIMVAGIGCLVFGAVRLMEADAVADEPAVSAERVTWPNSMPRGYYIALPLEHEYEGQNEALDRWYRNHPRATEPQPAEPT